MEKNMLKHIIHFTAAMSLCTILAGSPYPGFPATGEDGMPPKIITENPGGETPDGEPEIVPQNDLMPKITNES